MPWPTDSRVTQRGVRVMPAGVSRVPPKRTIALLQLRLVACAVARAHAQHVLARRRAGVVSTVVL